MESFSAKNQLLTSILDGVSEAIIATDSKGQVTFLNRPAQKFIGISLRGAFGKLLKDILVLKDSATDKRLKIPAPKSFRENINPHKLTRAMCVGEHGRTLLVDILVTPIVGTRQKIMGVVVVAHDVTKRVKHERLAHEQWRIKSIGKIANTVAKDFADYLGAISGHASSILDNIIPNTRAYDEAEKIIEAADYAAALIKRLTNIARSADVDKEADLQPVAVNTVVANAISIVETTFLQRNIIFKVQSPDSMPYAMGNEREIRDCLISLFMNAADAIDCDGTISIDCVEKCIDKDTFSVIRVRDSGTGMSKEVLEQMFDPFFTKKASENAMGLGLTVMRSTVQKLGGFVKVRSLPGRGASFRIFLKKAKRAKPSKKKSETYGETIVLLDDHENDRTKAHDILRTAGYKVHTAKNASECMDIHKTHGDTVSVSIIDVFMPDSDGKTVLKDILTLDPSASIIMTSGFSRDYVRSYIEHGTWRFLQKPWEPDHLLATVRSVIDKKNISREKSAIA